MDGKIFRNVQKASESHLPVDSVSIHGYGPKSGQQRLESLRTFYLAVVCRRDKVALSFYKIALEGDTQQEGLHERHGLEAWLQGSVR